MNTKLILLLILSISLISLTFAEEITIPDNSSINDTIIPIPNITITQIVNVTSIYPTEVKTGDNIIAIQVENIGNSNLSYLIPLISGNGFSAYEAIPIESLVPGSSSYILVKGNFQQAGTITLDIRINNQLFSQNIQVTSPTIEEQEKLKQENAAILANLSSQLSELKNNFTILENETATKKDDNYDVSSVNLADLRSYIRTTDSNILSENADNAKVNYRLAIEEYVYQKSKLDNAKKISTLDRIKNNALIFSAIAGAVIVFFSLFELLKRKQSDVVQVVRDVHGKITKKKDDESENKKDKK
jgi:hypothetical protein